MKPKPFLILQLRGIDEAADGEYHAFLRYGGLKEGEVHRIRMERESIKGLDPTEYSAIIVGGGPSNVSDPEVEKPEFQKVFERELDQLYKQIFKLDFPYFGNCYGLGSLVQARGGEVSRKKYGEVPGVTTVRLTKEGTEDPLLQGLSPVFTAFCGHKESVQNVPEEALLLGTSDHCLVQILRFQKNIYAIQFHGELDAEGLAERIRIYKYHGYFPPDSADSLIEQTRKVVAPVPNEIFRRFIDRYRVK